MKAKSFKEEGKRCLTIKNLEYAKLVQQFVCH